MTPLQEMVKTLLDPETISMAYNQSNKEYQVFDKFGMSFCLTNTALGIIHLELRSFYLINNTETIMYWKPIGFYKIANKTKNEVVIVILNEFVSELETLRPKGDLQINNKIEKLDLIPNALIAAFSIDAHVHVLDILKRFNPNADRFYFDEKIGVRRRTDLMHDKYFRANGFDCEILMADERIPQFFLDQKYQNNNPFVAYIFKNGEISYNLRTEYESIFGKLRELKLLSVFNPI